MHDLGESVGELAMVVGEALGEKRQVKTTIQAKEEALN